MIIMLEEIFYWNVVFCKFCNIFFEMDYVWVMIIDEYDLNEVNVYKVNKLLVEI